MPKRFLRVFINDGLPVFRDGVVGFVQGQPAIELRGEARSLDDVSGSLRRHKPDVCILELDGVRIDISGLVKKLKRASSRTRYPILVKKSQTSAAQKALTAGAAGVIVKDKTMAELLGALGRAAHATRELAVPARRGSGEARRVLTDREIEVLRLLASGRTVREVAALLDLSPKTVDAHKTNMMRKLKLHSRLELFRWAVRHKLAKA